jgi:hypothetical protein
MDLPYRAEYAKSGRAGCKTCKTKIDQGTLRIAAMVQVEINLIKFQKPVSKYAKKNIFCSVFLFSHFIMTAKIRIGITSVASS